VKQRIGDFNEFYQHWPEKQIKEQGGRCMGCAVPFCHGGCPLGNLIPDWNDLVYKGEWKHALNALHATNNFPEFTGRICPAPCEASCVLSINEEPVTIEYIEKAIVDRGFEKGWISPNPPEYRTGKKVAVIGSGPAGLASAQQLNRAGHLVTVFERDEYIGGLLRLGIPDFKLEKSVVQRRVELMRQEGIDFRTDVNVGINQPVADLEREFDAICLTIGSTTPRDLQVPGRNLTGIHFAMEYLTQQNRRISGVKMPSGDAIIATNKTVIILGGGDTGADCLGTAHRQRAKEVIQCEILSEPPKARKTDNPWPQWPLVFRSSAAHEEGGDRKYDITTKAFSGKDGSVQSLTCAQVEWVAGQGMSRPEMREIAGGEFEIKADLVLLAMGFVHPEHDGLLTDLKVDLDQRGNVKLDGRRMSSKAGVFAAGDAARGQSLVVWAIAEGRETARCIDEYLMGSSELPPINLLLQP
jgi:glutamate synthase (NADPH/NADH) small chain